MQWRRWDQIGVKGHQVSFMCGAPYTFRICNLKKKIDVITLNIVCRCTVLKPVSFNLNNLKWLTSFLLCNSFLESASSKTTCGLPNLSNLWPKEGRHLILFDLNLHTLWLLYDFSPIYKVWDQYVLGEGTVSFSHMIVWNRGWVMQNLNAFDLRGRQAGSFPLFNKTLPFWKSLWSWLMDHIFCKLLSYLLLYLSAYRLAHNWLLY